MSQGMANTTSTTLAAHGDRVLPALHYFMYPDSATSILREAWDRSNIAGPAPTVRTVHLVRYHPGKRCTLWLDCDTWPSGGCFAKVYARNDEAIARTLSTVERAGFGDDSPQRISTLLMADPTLHLLLYKKAPGRPLHHSSTAQLPEAAAHAAQWLGRFHASTIPLPASYALHDPMAAAKRWCARILTSNVTSAPTLHDDASRVLAALAQAQRPWPPTVRLLHGDFSVTHVYLASDVTSVIDWDSARPGDPAEDAGRFVASLYDLVARQHPLAQSAGAAVTRFRTEYARTQPTVAEALPFFIAWACLRKASRLTLRPAPRQERAAAMLQFALVCLLESSMP